MWLHPSSKGNHIQQLVFTVVAMPDDNDVKHIVLCQISSLGDVLLAQLPSAGDTHTCPQLEWHLSILFFQK